MKVYLVRVLVIALALVAGMFVDSIVGSSALPVIHRYDCSQVPEVQVPDAEKAEPVEPIVDATLEPVTLTAPVQE